ncbi:HotDog domain-containing protein [Fimicolochytrium jonesii]|uniref:HotDog domain-containing protein n=1 Tax=Fimicolochytrium jonesii TaxID=1396493 RepID=UPI0022FEDBD1|nr:HotDog domain-containing protein [Fimicolochytrium jonesii]KAI8824384.1 HotDog domain-containing protein [Fimicolochytrium jonesii]
MFSKTGLKAYAMPSATSAATSAAKLLPRRLSPSLTGLASHVCRQSPAHSLVSSRPLSSTRSNYHDQSSAPAQSKHVPVGGFATVPEIREALPPKVADLVEDYPSLTTLPVQWGEQDPFGHLNNVIYLRYFESGRIAYFDQIIKPGLTQRAYNSFIQARGVGPIVKTVSCKYKSPVRYPDTITVGVRIPRETLEKDRFVQEAVLVSHAQGRVVATAECQVVTYDYGELRKADIPPEVIKAWKAGEGIK